jgi:hypothetical protein
MNAFSFCIYGQNEYYYKGLAENVRLINTHYPDWLIYIYVGNDARTDLLEQIHHLSTKICWRETHEAGAVNMIYRFFAIDEPTVSTLHVRDADSRIHERDRWAIDLFMKSSTLAYTIRDNQAHGTQMMGGLWGTRRLPFSVQQMFQMYRTPLYAGDHGCGYDQKFLAQYVYPNVVYSFMVFTNYHVLSRYEQVVPFDPSLRTDVFCGMPE